MKEARKLEYNKSASDFVVEFIESGDLSKCNETITAAFAFVINDKGNILTIQNERGWDIPGGHVDRGETVLDAAIREVDEEASVDIENVKAFALIRNGSTAMAVFTAKPKLVKEFAANVEDPTSDRTFMSVDDFIQVYSGGNKHTMSQLTAELTKRIRSGVS